MRISALLPLAFIVTAGLSTSGCLSGADSADDPESTDDGAEAVAASDANACSFPYTKLVTVDSSAKLSQALSQAKPGTMIKLAPATYAGTFEVDNVSGTAASPIVVCGPRAAILKGAGTAHGTVFSLVNAQHWTLSGFSVTNAQKGIMLEGSSNNLIQGVEVHGVGEEGIHFKAGSTHNTLQNSYVHDTGTAQPEYGEGVYLGSAYEHWVSGQPDRSDYNKVLNNTLGPNVAAECIDVKEGTTGATISGNTFNGKGEKDQNSGDSWIDVKGNKNVISGNTGSNAFTNAFQAHQQKPGWGNDNIFDGNTVVAGVPGAAFAFDGKVTGNVVRCTNKAPGAKGGLGVKCTN